MPVARSPHPAAAAAQPCPALDTPARPPHPATVPSARTPHPATAQPQAARARPPHAATIARAPDGVPRAAQRASETSSSSSTIAVVVNDATTAREAATQLLAKGIKGAKRLHDELQTAADSKDVATLNGYVFQTALAVHYFNQGSLADVEVAFKDTSNGARYLDILLKDGTKIEAKKYSDKTKDTDFQRSFEQQLVTYAAAINAGNLPGPKALHYQFDVSSHGVPGWAQTVLEMHAADLPDGLFLNGKRLVKPRTLESMMGSMAKVAADQKAEKATLADTGQREILLQIASAGSTDAAVKIAKKWLAANGEDPDDDGAVAALLRDADRLS
jgi:hypothetical protein